MGAERRSAEILWTYSSQRRHPLDTQRDAARTLIDNEEVRPPFGRIALLLGLGLLVLLLLGGCDVDKPKQNEPSRPTLGADAKATMTALASGGERGAAASAAAPARASAPPSSSPAAQSAAAKPGSPASSAAAAQ